MTSIVFGQITRKDGYEKKNLEIKTMNLDFKVYLEINGHLYNTIIEIPK